MSRQLRSIEVLADQVSYTPASPKTVKATTNVDRAANILRDNVYGWFEKVERGIYGAITSAQVDIQSPGADAKP